MERYVVASATITTVLKGDDGVYQLTLETR